MKTKKYFVEVEFCENQMIKKLEVSKKEFELQLKFLKNSAIVSQQMEYECPIVETEWSNKMYEHANHTETIYVFQSGCCNTYLTILETKEGYCFAKGVK